MLACLASRYRQVSAEALAAQKRATEYFQEVEATLPEAPRIIMGTYTPVRGGRQIREEESHIPMTRSYIEHALKGERRTYALAARDSWDQSRNEVLAARGVFELE